MFHDNELGHNVILTVIAPQQDTRNRYCSSLLHYKAIKDAFQYTTYLLQTVQATSQYFMVATSKLVAISLGAAAEIGILTTNCSTCFPVSVLCIALDKLERPLQKGRFIGYIEHMLVYFCKDRIARCET